MKKDITRDYAVAAFRKYAALGEPDEDSARAYSPPALAADILAARSCLTELEKVNPTAASAIRAVYMYSPTRPLSKRIITSRVLRFAAENYISERTVYSALASARRLFAVKRGLYTG